MIFRGTERTASLSRKYRVNWIEANGLYMSVLIGDKGKTTCQGFGLLGRGDNNDG